MRGTAGVWGGLGGGFNVFYWRKIFALDFVTCKACLDLIEVSYLCNASSQRNYLIEFTYYNNGSAMTQW